MAARVFGGTFEHRCDRGCEIRVVVDCQGKDWVLPFVNHAELTNFSYKIGDRGGIWKR